MKKCTICGVEDAVLTKGEILHHGYTNYATGKPHGLGDYSDKCVYSDTHKGGLCLSCWKSSHWDSQPDDVRIDADVTCSCPDCRHAWDDAVIKPLTAAEALAFIEAHEVQISCYFNDGTNQWDVWRGLSRATGDTLLSAVENYRVKMLREEK